MKTPIVTLLTQPELDVLSKQDNLDSLLRLDIAIERLERLSRNTEKMCHELEAVLKEYRWYRGINYDSKWFKNKRRIW